MEAITVTTLSFSNKLLQLARYQPCVPPLSHISPKRRQRFANLLSHHGLLIVQAWSGEEGLIGRKGRFPSTMMSLMAGVMLQSILRNHMDNLAYMYRLFAVDSSVMMKRSSRCRCAGPHIGPAQAFADVDAGLTNFTFPNSHFDTSTTACTCGRRGGHCACRYPAETAVAISARLFRWQLCTKSTRHGCHQGRALHRETSYTSVKAPHVVMRRVY